MSGKLIRNTLRNVIHIQEARLILAFLIAVITAFGQPAPSQTGPEPRQRAWEQLQQLHPGDKIRVELNGKPGMTGDFAAVTAEGLQLARQNEQFSLARPEIRRVWVFHASGRSRARAAAPWIGAAVGFGGGFGIGAGAMAGCSNICISKPAAGAIIGVVGAGAGALVGYLVSGKSERRILVYQQ